MLQQRSLDIVDNNQLWVIILNELYIYSQHVFQKQRKSFNVANILWLFTVKTKIGRFNNAWLVEQFLTRLSSHSHVVLLRESVHIQDNS